ncbi:hypothetical protein [Flavobacterium defluvii]|uniref:Uncharacterized protein n=1 Tax=Flavobacterium defluvii TaxID=370979 RepID=A0A1M5JB95_9FLAO|nr:hypothetical protein [Flavobacterium defluvii]SHG37771.1 hypothetical protein SAMN05443663_102663 [Flavobacterium defluvii]
MDLKKIYIFLLALSVNSLHSQESRRQPLPTSTPYMDKLMKQDYFSRKYSFLDDNYKVRMGTADFEKYRKKYNFPASATSKDSLALALMAEFNNWDQARIAEMRLSYSWVRLGYHLLLSESETIELAKTFKISHPWLLKESISKGTAPLAQKAAADLRKRLKKLEPDLDFSMMAADELMRKALEINPVRKQKFLQEGKHKH